MTLRFATVLLIALAAPALLPAQATGAHATPATEGTAPAGINNTAGVPERQPVAAATGQSSQRSGTPARSQAGGGRASRGGSQPSNAGNAAGGALPGVSILHNGLGIVAGTPITVRLQQTVTSAEAHNGDTVHGVLAEPLGSLPNGAPVDLTVVAAARAGVVGSGGVLSLQVTRISGDQVLSQVITTQGKEGPKLLADDAPGRGSEAEFPQDQPITLPAA